MDAPGRDALGRDALGRTPGMPASVAELPTPAVLIDADRLEHNLATMAAIHPGSALRPHVKAHKCSRLAAAQAAHGHRAFTCATPREMLGMVRAGLGDDLLLANECVDPVRLRALAAAQDEAMITVAVDSDATVAAAAAAGIEHVLVDVDIGLPRCGCRPDDAGRIADLARARGLTVRGVMGYEGHLMMVADPVEHRRRVDEAVESLLAAHAAVGGDVISSGGTGTHHLHRRATEVQAGSYALMDSHYGSAGLPFVQACVVLGTVISVGGPAGRARAVADVGLKAMGMDHGNPVLEPGTPGTVGALGTVGTVGGTVWFLSDEHVTFAPDRPASVGDRVRVVPAHIDPTMALHEVAWLVRDDEVLDRWEIDLRGW